MILQDRREAQICLIQRIKEPWDRPCVDFQGGSFKKDDVRSNSGSEACGGQRIRQALIYLVANCRQVKRGKTQIH